ncbi:MAG: hypothetical protein D6772_03410, partial [Bacteroidetes bacterium]
PLLFARRRELEAYQQARGLAYREDETNHQDDYTRNYLRHQVLPHLYHVQARLSRVVQGNFARLQQTEAFLRAQMELLRANYATTDEFGREVFDRAAIEAHPQADLLLWEWFSPLGFSVEQIRQLRFSQSGTILRASTWELLVTTPHWILRQQADPARQEWAQSWPEDCPTIVLPDGRQLYKSRVEDSKTDFSVDAKHTIHVAAEALIFPLALRYPKPGDTFCPFGMRGHSQKLKDFLVKQKIDRWQRAHTPLLLNGDGSIIWVVGHRLDERFAVRTEAPCYEIKLMKAPSVQ